MQFIVNVIAGTFDMIRDFLMGGFEKGWDFIVKHRKATYTILLLLLIVGYLIR